MTYELEIGSYPVRTRAKKKLLSPRCSTQVLKAPSHVAQIYNSPLNNLGVTQHPLKPVHHAELHHSRCLRLPTKTGALPRGVTNSFVWEMRRTLGYCSDFVFLLPIFSGYSSEQLCKLCTKSRAEQECHTSP